ncbi:aldehyde dehydrogenase family protein [Rhodococcus hoagii]|nr:aldehyde dehydrogenase family protein [Prescottella equi]
MTHTEELVSINPATLEEVGRTPVTTPDELDSRIEDAHTAFSTWRTDRTYRQGLLASCSYELMRKIPEIVPLLSMEQGKTAEDAGGEVWISAKCLAHNAQVEWDDVTAAPEAAGRTARIEHRPLGVVAAIVPWNFPIFLMMAKIAPALAAGNTVVVKPAESVSLVVGKVVEILQSVLPKGVLDIVHGGPDIGRALVEHRRIRKVSFTGSTGVGRQIMRQAADTVTPVTLELGGNDPPSCWATPISTTPQLPREERVLQLRPDVHRPQTRLRPGRPGRSLLRGIRHRDGYPAGRVRSRTRHQDRPLHNKAQIDFVQGLLDKAVAGGGTVGTGRWTRHRPAGLLPRTHPHPRRRRTATSSPSNSRGVFPSSRTQTSKTCSPHSTSRLRLGASVWGSVENAEKIADRIDAGQVWINQHNALEVELPFGGVKSSGFGREGGTAGPRFLDTRVVSIKK